MQSCTLARPVMARISAETGMALRAAMQDHLMYQIPVSMMWSVATRFWPGQPSSPLARRPLPSSLRRSLVRNIENKPRHDHCRQQGSSNSCQCFRVPQGSVLLPGFHHSIRRTPSPSSCNERPIFIYFCIRPIPGIYGHHLAFASAFASNLGRKGLRQIGT
ncbi:hypothetical protein BO94DRAFT_350952 [Aspergillus sclerotioniger CBS 115572]|uniref:Uncharacterized protein n=1 Tax=Aspergillus sclerotioniger CBS 115572 TaxID=1450535 RepID=A0A317X6E4_9EURO|nr:hypothetical protein BO94DRAFT_350952 [Aspergillus sclerotioniger CBS 115572]PWY93741.1 hypothetical protein BO94DRAFT_350952 [Aspergillus sclerotioniger CBS 115572]